MANAVTTIQGDLGASHSDLLDIQTQLRLPNKLDTLRILLPIIAREVKRTGIRDVGQLTLQRPPRLQRTPRLTREPPQADYPENRHRADG